MKQSTITASRQHPHYAPYEAPYWKRAFEREDAESQRSTFGRLNYDSIVNAAYDYMQAENEYHRKARGRWIIGQEMRDLYARYAKYEAVFCAVCEATAIPQQVAIAAARIFDRYYERHGGTLTVDTAALIRALL